MQTKVIAVCKGEGLMGWDGMGGEHTLGDWPALSGSNSSGFLLQKRGNPVSVGAPENSPKESGAVRTGIGRRRVLHRVFEWSADDLLIDLGLELLEPALQALDGVHALQQKRPETVSSIGVPKKDQTKLGALDAV